MEAGDSSDTLKKTTRRHIPEDSSRLSLFAVKFLILLEE
jgi:hypothetical protein